MTSKLPTVEEAKQALATYLDNIEDSEKKERMLKRQWAIEARLKLCKSDVQRCMVIHDMMMDSFLEMDKALIPFRNKEK